MNQSSEKNAKNIIGAAVRRIRLAQRVPVSQQDLAGRMAAKGVFIDQSAIARIERGERFVADYEVAAIAKAFRVPIEQLFARK